MKQLLFVLLVFSYFCCTAQSSNNINPVLLLSKNGASYPVELKIKGNKPIKVKMADGRKMYLSDYSLIGDSVIATSTDTVALGEIASIKGKLKGSALRKIGGGLVAGTGYYFVAVGYLVGTIALYPPAFLLILPSAGVAYTGHYISGMRHFDTTEKWKLSIAKVE
ncbi:hypothetical protein ACFSRY_02045 [Pontibacter locisalis]|uniref:Uncharacterized protein n=1 Tax=Pontibacter locisalis TaxID=1719035 RepID=A0ABW5IG48_9BACT